MAIVDEWNSRQAFELLDQALLYALVELLSQHVARSRGIWWWIRDEKLTKPAVDEAVKELIDLSHEFNELGKIFPNPLIVAFVWYR